MATPTPSQLADYDQSRAAAVDILKTAAAAQRTVPPLGRPLATCYLANQFAELAEPEKLGWLLAVAIDALADRGYAP